MSKQSKPTKRQMRNLKVVRSMTNGQLWVGNTKTLRYHCWAKCNDVEQEVAMINEVAKDDAGVMRDKTWISGMWNGQFIPSPQQIRL